VPDQLGSWLRMRGYYSSATISHRKRRLIAFNRVQKVVYKMCKPWEDSTNGSWDISQKVASIMQIGQGLKIRGFSNPWTISHRKMRIVAFNKTQKVVIKMYQSRDDSTHGSLDLGRKVFSPATYNRPRASVKEGVCCNSRTVSHRKMRFVAFNRAQKVIY